MAMFKMPKHVPKWAWYVSGGVGIAGVIFYVKNHKSVSPADATAQGDSTGAIGYTDAQNMPGIIVVPQQPGAAPVSNGGGSDLSALYIGAIGDLFASQEDITSQLLGALLGTGGGAGSTGSTSSTGGTVSFPPAPVAAPPPPPPPPAPEPAPAPAPAPAPPPPPPEPAFSCGSLGMEDGGSAGTCSPGGAICRQMLRCDTNSNGHYCTWKFHFQDGHANCFNHYSSGNYSGRCVGPFGCP